MNLLIPLKHRRLKLPEAYVLPRSTVVVTAAPGPCLLLFRPEVWMSVRAYLLNPESPVNADANLPVSTVSRLLLSYARDISVSGRGVIDLDDDLTAVAGIQGRVLWVPSQNVIELWNPARFEPSDKQNAIASLISMV